MTGAKHIPGPILKAEAVNPVNPDTTGLKNRIKALLREQNAVLVAHYYTDAALQELAEETGGCVADSCRAASV